MRIGLSVLALVAGLVGGWAAVGPAPAPPPAASVGGRENQKVSSMPRRDTIVLPT